MFTLGAVMIMVSGLAAGDEWTLGPLETVGEGFQFTEGPVWMPGTGFIFSDIPADTIYLTSKSVFRKPSGNSNGLLVDREGRLIACENGNRRVTRTEKDATITVLADRFEGKRLNSPNDMVMRSDGTLYFTDPAYGVDDAARELDFCGVFMIAPDGKLTCQFKDAATARPNGIALSVDEKTLYLSDAEANNIRAFSVAEDGSLSGVHLFYDVPHPDGMKIDAESRLWTTSQDSIRIFSPDAKLLGSIFTPKTPANCAFGGDDGQTLLITARDTVYQVRVKAKGLFRAVHP